MWTFANIWCVFVCVRIETSLEKALFMKIFSVTGISEAATKNQKKKKEISTEIYVITLNKMDWM